MWSKGPKGEGGAAAVVSRYRERCKAGDMLASPVPPNVLQRACFGRFTYWLVPWWESGGAYGGLPSER